MLVNNENLFPLQYLLMKIQSEIASLQRIQPGVHVTNLPGEALKMATCVLTVGPIILLYPYLQKYFIKGLIIGGVKG
jgi:putative aldouronate transport system permease protein